MTQYVANDEGRYLSPPSDSYLFPLSLAWVRSSRLNDKFGFWVRQLREVHFGGPAELDVVYSLKHYSCRGTYDKTRGATWYKRLQ